MSLQYKYDQLARLEKEIADIQKKIADESKKEADKQKKIDSISRSINNNTSPSTIQSKQRQIINCQQEIVRIQSKKADLLKKQSTKTAELTRKKQEVAREEKKEREKQQREQQEFQKQQQEYQKQLQADISDQKKSLDDLISQTYISPNTKSDNLEVKEHDFFISHASEDKESFVRPLAEALIEAGYNVWYDEHHLKVGDSLRKKIDEGLKYSKFGIVVLSSNFFEKNWTEYELNGLVAREMNGVKVILPIWHKVTKDEVLKYSPTLADKVALNTTIHSIKDIVMKLSELFD